MSAKRNKAIEQQRLYLSDSSAFAGGTPAVPANPLTESNYSI